MRKIINSTYITLDGAVENPHLWPSFSGGAGSDVSFDVQTSLLHEYDAVLMGRRTYESFASVWPTRSGDKMSDRINAMQKYAVSTTLRDPKIEKPKLEIPSALLLLTTLSVIVMQAQATPPLRWSAELRANVLLALNWNGNKLKTPVPELLLMMLLATVMKAPETCPA